MKVGGTSDVLFHIVVETDFLERFLKMFFYFHLFV